MACSSAAAHTARVHCPSCARQFKTGAALEQHRAAAHTADAPGIIMMPQQYSGDSRIDLPWMKLRVSDSPHQYSITVAISSIATINPFSAPSPAASIDPPMSRPVCCSDCGRPFTSVDSLHQHQWDSPSDHTRVANSRMPLNPAIRECSRCDAKLSGPSELEEHYTCSHPLQEITMKKQDEAGAMEWLTISSLFLCSWRNPTASPPTVLKIFKVYNMGRRRWQYEQYKKALKKDISGHATMRSGAVPDDVRLKVLKNGNEVTRFHGTTCMCTLGTLSHNGRGTDPLCSDPACGACGILKHGFKPNKCRQDRWQRFGKKATYVSGTSSKANDYVQCPAFADIHSSSSSAKMRMMFVCNVLAGNIFHSAQNMPRLKGPPPGFHSVYGVPGEVLNYDELAVYDEGAIIPTYLILYGIDCEEPH